MASRSDRSCAALCSVWRNSPANSACFARKADMTWSSAIRHSSFWPHRTPLRFGGVCYIIPGKAARISARTRLSVRGAGLDHRRHFRVAPSLTFGKPRTRFDIGGQSAATRRHLERHSVARSWPGIDGVVALQSSCGARCPRSHVSGTKARRCQAAPSTGMNRNGVSTALAPRNSGCPQPAPPRAPREILAWMPAAFIRSAPTTRKPSRCCHRPGSPARYRPRRRSTQTGCWWSPTCWPAMTKPALSRS